MAKTKQQQQQQNINKEEKEKEKRKKGTGNFFALVASQKFDKIRDTCRTDQTYHPLPRNVKEALSVSMLCAPNNQQPFLHHTKMADFEYFLLFSVFS